MFISMLLGGRVVYTGKDIHAAHARAREEGLNDTHFANRLGIRPMWVETTSADNMFLGTTHEVAYQNTWFGADRILQKRS
jgi:hypothetical protein